MVKTFRVWGTLTMAMLVVSLLIATFFSVGSIGYTQNKEENSLCGSCHEMQPQINSWRLSTHGRIGCLKCHPNVPMTELAYKHWRGFYNQPIKKKTIVPNAVCLDCHSRQRDISPPGGLVVPHEYHTQKGVDCVDCHAGLVHSTRQPGSPRIKMPVCLKCHNGSKATNQCKDCHGENVPKQ
ncbi:MAG: cytochrome c3 family protein [Bacillota bacterium]|uniref:NapC/NirT cytochrome c family, N-terminal region n=2 Tax=Carboxydocella TaxID=178898 RepID=A0A1T4MJC3_9FIRM|nr:MULTISPECIES: cytochrome c3 family protein [Carboxydocella]AVX21348.1 Cytochrome c7 [Carboxydocella thermautotrophica]AVX31776.1 Cytochrome c7 [Carboxydocella thermautotrophica]SJZ66967.1 NapC/NirT cytochrome c family, N-terminal region [Carboxydocella sporoproducens DSM 16521]